MTNLQKGISIAAVLLITFVLLGISSKLTIVHYSIDTPLGDPHRLALVTDLHSSRYGKEAEELIEAIKSEEPEVVLLGGDFFDDVITDEQAEFFLRGITPFYPTYYVTGNHEYWAGSEAFQEKMEILKTYGVTRLSGDVIELHLGQDTVQLGGVDDPDINDYNMDPKKLFFEEQLEMVEEAVRDSSYSILLTHRPELAYLYEDMSFDLILAGHAHGGQWRIPGLLNGLFSPGQGLFPDYAGGYYELGDHEMIVSRGLARESTPIPRIYNRPELVILQLEPSN